MQLEPPARLTFVGTNPQFTGFLLAILLQLSLRATQLTLRNLRLLNLATRSLTRQSPIRSTTSARTCAFFVSSVLRLQTGALASYIHPGGKLADIVTFEFNKPETAESQDFKNFAHDVAMQVAAVAPVAARRGCSTGHR